MAIDSSLAFVFGEQPVPFSFLFFLWKGTHTQETDGNIPESAEKVQLEEITDNFGGGKKVMVSTPQKIAASQ
jgi:hypothetical protein